MIKSISHRVQTFGVQKLLVLLFAYALMIGMGVWDALHPMHLYIGPDISEISPDGKYEAHVYHIKDEWGLGTLRQYYLFDLIDLDTGLSIAQHQLPFGSTANNDASSLQNISWNNHSTLVQFGNPTNRVWSFKIP